MNELGLLYECDSRKLRKFIFKELAELISQTTQSDKLKRWPFKAKNNAQTTSEQLQTNIEKAQKTGSSALEMVKMTLSERQNLSYKFDFIGYIYRPFEL